MMKRRWMSTVVFAALVAFATPRAFAGEHDKASHPDDPSAYIMHHVSDSADYEFEMPGPLYTGNNPVVHLDQVFSALLIETKPNACEPFHDHTSTFDALFAGCVDLRPTKHTVMLWLAAFLLILAVFLGSNRNKNQLVPRGTSQNLFEMLVVYIRDEIAIKNIGTAEGPRFTPYLLTAFFFILFMNLLGLVPWMATATANIAVTAGLALCTFVLTQIAGIRAAGLGGYLKHLTGGVAWWLWPIMVPVEVLGLFTKPFALTMRLFANMLAGHIVIFSLLGLIFMLHPGMAAVSVPMAMGIYVLELFVAFLQAYVFTMLSALFIGMSVAMGHHAHDDHGHAEGAGDHSHAHGSHAHGKAHG
ncbi:MAG: F0F1 ATP synthase subunit A [Myxococcaceae bacterium]